MSVPAPQSPVPGHETRDIRVGAVTKFGIGIAAVLLLTMAGMIVLLRYYQVRDAAVGPRRNPLAGSYGLAQPPEPRLQINPAADIAALRAQEHAVLESYGWADREAGRVHIPIARAMELLVQQRGGGQAR